MRISQLLGRNRITGEMAASRNIIIVSSTAWFDVLCLFIVSQSGLLRHDSFKCGHTTK